MRRSAPLLFASLLLAACGDVASSDTEALVESDLEAMSAEGKSDGGGGLYFRARKDTRRCASPQCGGYFVRYANFSATRCADGRWANECYVASLDLSGLGLSADEIDSVETAAAEGRAILRGVLSQGAWATGVQVAKLGVSEAWSAPNANPPAGFFNRVTETQIQCVTTPCINPISTRYLNASLPAQSLRGVDLTASGATDAEVATAQAEQASKEGLVVAGYRRTQQGSAGRGVYLFGTQFYTRVRHVEVPSYCGTRGGIQCPAGMYCELSVQCGRADQGGTCMPQPQVCNKLYKPVCGCDGQTYGNDCMRQSAGVSKEHDGPCGCKVTGCSGEICADQDVASTCIYKPEFACYQGATCERQADGACGWTQTAALTACLAGK